MGPAAIPTAILFTAAQWAVILIVLAAGAGLKALVLWWLYRDTHARGRDPLVWLLFAIPFDIPTLIVWLSIRPPAPVQARAEPIAVGQSGAAPADSLTGAVPPAAAPAPAQPAPVAAGEAPQASFSRVRLTCPRCAARFVVERVPDAPTAFVCPSCGTKGRL